MGKLVIELPDALKEDFATAAAARKKSMTAIMVDAIRRWVDKEKAKEEAKGE